MSTIVSPVSEYEQSLFKRKDYVICGSPISSGSFASVYRAKRKGEKIAVKIIDCEMNSEDYRYKFLPRELYSLKKLKHPYIITVHDIFTVSNRIFIFMELAEGGDFIDLVRNGPLPESRTKVLYKQIITAIQFIHSLGIAHRDIKCENIILNKSQTKAKLTDFGFARICFENKTGRKMLSETHCGSAAYVAPEVLESGPYDAIRADCWSTGVVLYVLVNNRLPFTDRHIAYQLKKQKNKSFIFVVELSPECEELIKKLLNPDFKSRFNMSEVLAHKWLINVKLD